MRSTQRGVAPAAAGPMVAGAAMLIWLMDTGIVSAAPDGTFGPQASGTYFTCGMREDDTVECWGSNDYGKASRPAGSFVSVTRSDRHGCGLREDGSVECWGDDEFGQATPVEGYVFTSVSAGDDHTCALTDDYRIRCWGSDLYGQSTPQTTGRRYFAVTAGPQHTCAFERNLSFLGLAGVEHDRVSHVESHSSVVRSTTGDAELARGATEMAHVVAAVGGWAAARTASLMTKTLKRWGVIAGAPILVGAAMLFWLMSTGIAFAESVGSFGPREEVTRQDMVVLVYRALGVVDDGRRNGSVTGSYACATKQSFGDVGRSTRRRLRVLPT